MKTASNATKMSAISASIDKFLRRTSLLASAVLFIVSASANVSLSAEEGSSLRRPLFDPVEKQIEGWKVHIDPQLLDDSQEGEEALEMLANHLQRIAILVPQETLTQLRSIEIWIEKDHKSLKTMQYHPSRGWLVEHGHDPRLAKKVHITQASQLLSREQMLKHPAVVLHELAHGYHDQILGFDNAEVIEAFQAAKRAGTYEKVLLYTGDEVRHYGLSNHKEYFAEGTEAFFYRNDFYPFVRAELEQADPKLHDLLERVWRAK